MERKAFLALRKPRWEKLFTDMDLEVEIVPSNMPDLTTAKLIGTKSEAVSRQICTDAFIDFRGYTEDGKKVENTLDNRLELYGFPVVGKAINNALEVRNYEVVTGESSAASG